MLFFTKEFIFYNMKTKGDEKAIGKADLVLLFCVLLIAFFGLFFYEKLKSPGHAVRIQSGQETIKTLPLSADTEFSVTTDAGENRVIIKNGEVLVKEADCPDKLCVKHRAIHSVGETIICLPHKLVVEVVE